MSEFTDAVAAHLEQVCGTVMGTPTGQRLGATVTVDQLTSGLVACRLSP